MAGAFFLPQLAGPARRARARTRAGVSRALGGAQVGERRVPARGDDGVGVRGRRGGSGEAGDDDVQRRRAALDGGVPPGLGVRRGAMESMEETSALLEDKARSAIGVGLGRIWSSSSHGHGEVRRRRSKIGATWWASGSSE